MFNYGVQSDRLVELVSCGIFGECCGLVALTRKVG